MNKPILKDMIQNESHTNPPFQKGRKYTQALVLIYIAVRFSDPIVAPILAKIPFELNSQILLGLVTALCVGFIAVIGSVKPAGVLCLLTSVSNIAMMLTDARSYTGGFVEMMRIVPNAWYILVLSILCAIIGVWLLADKNIAAFGKRRKALQKEYAASLKAWKTPSTAAEGEQPQDEVTASEAERPQEEIAELMREFQGEESTLWAFSQVNVLCKVSKKRFFDVYRELLCKKFDCSEIEIDPATYVITFPSGGKMLMQWLQEEKRLCMESNTKNYDVQFHKLAIDAIAYLGKNMGFTLITTDMSGYADSNDENRLKDYFDKSV